MLGSVDTMLQCAAVLVIRSLLYNVLVCGFRWWSVSQCGESVVLCFAVGCYVVIYGEVWCYAVLFCAVWYYALHNCGVYS